MNTDLTFNKSIKLNNVTINNKQEELFGYSLSMSKDGKRLLVSSVFSKEGVEKETKDNKSRVYVYNNNNNNESWELEHILVSEEDHYKYNDFGISTDISDIGDVIAVGCICGFSNSQNTKVGGKVYVYRLLDKEIIDRYIITLDELEDYDNFGHSLSLSSDGNLLAISAISRSIEGYEECGIVYIFSFNSLNNSWELQDRLIASNKDTGDRFGVKIKFNKGDTTNRLVISTCLKTNKNTHKYTLGTVYVFSKNEDNKWIEEYIIENDITETDTAFGLIIDINDEGSRIAITDHLFTYNNLVNCGCVHVYDRTDTAWNKIRYIIDKEGDIGDYFGIGMTMDRSGNFIAVAASNKLHTEPDKSGVIFIYNYINNKFIEQKRFLNDTKSSNYGFVISLCKNMNVLLTSNFIIPEDSDPDLIEQDIDNLNNVIMYYKE